MIRYAILKFFKFFLRKNLFTTRRTLVFRGTQFAKRSSRFTRIYTCCWQHYQHYKKKLYFLLWRPPTTFRLSKISPRTTATNGPGWLLWITNRDNAHRSAFQPSVDPCGPPKNNDANIVINLSEFRHVSYRYLYWPCNTHVVFRTEHIRTEHNKMFKIKSQVIAMPKAWRDEDSPRILNQDILRRKVLSFFLRPPYAGKK